MRKLNKKTVAFTITIVALFLMMPLANSAYTPPQLVVWTDKADYSAGESGTLYIRFYNEGDGAVTVKRILVVYNEWVGYVNDKWEGNQTIDVNKAIASKEVFKNETRFTVPTDGRAVPTQVKVTIEFSEVGTLPSTTYYDINVVKTPRYMENIVTLFTVLVALVIVCTLIIAATIFLSARRPQVMWSKEEKTQ